MRVMSSITPALIAEKLVDWTPSCKVQELLGMTSMDTALFKEELHSLELKGIVIRDGVRRGLKFKSAQSDSITASNKEVKQPVISKKEKKAKKEKKVSKVDSRDIDCEATIFPRHEYESEVTKVSVAQLLSFILTGSNDSRTLSIKRTTKGIVIKTYRDIFCLSEVLYTKENFIKLLNASNISLD